MIKKNIQKIEDVNIIAEEIHGGVNLVR